jgi:hypothetical protein
MGRLYSSAQTCGAGRMRAVSTVSGGGSGRGDRQGRRGRRPQHAGGVCASVADGTSALDWERGRHSRARIRECDLFAIVLGCDWVEREGEAEADGGVCGGGGGVGGWSVEKQDERRDRRAWERARCNKDWGGSCRGRGRCESVAKAVPPLRRAVPAGDAAGQPPRRLPSFHAQRISRLPGQTERGKEAPWRAPGHPWAGTTGSCPPSDFSRTCTEEQMDEGGPQRADGWGRAAASRWIGKTTTAGGEGRRR